MKPKGFKHYLGMTVTISLTIGWGLIGLFLSILLAVWIMRSHPELTDTKGFTLAQCFGRSLEGGWPGLEVTFFCLFAAIATILRHNLTQRMFCDNVLEKIDNKNIVLYPGMQCYDVQHLCTLEEIVFPAITGKGSDSSHSPKERLLALDATDPSVWWTNDMLGYLGIQARWASEVSAREVVRVFVWGKDWLRSVSGTKLIALHRIMGCKTIICPPKIFYNIVRKDDLRREFFVWDDDNAVGANCRIGDNIYGYESYHRTYDDEVTRTEIIEKMTTPLSVDEKSFIKFKPLGVDRANKLRSIFKSIESKADSNLSTSKILLLDQLEITKILKKLNDFSLSQKW